MLKGSSLEPLSLQMKRVVFPEAIWVSFSSQHPVLAFKSGRLSLLHSGRHILIAKLPNKTFTFLLGEAPIASEMSEGKSKRFLGELRTGLALNWTLIGVAPLLGVPGRFLGERRHLVGVRGGVSANWHTGSKK